MTRIGAVLLALIVALGAACSGGARPQAKAEPAANPGAVLPPDPREAELAATVVELLEQEHLRDQPLDDATSKTAFAVYLERLDPGKVFLLAADADRLGRHADRIDDELRAGRLDLAHEGAALFATRIGVVEKLVAELLAAPLDHSDEEWIELDPEKLELAASEDALRERWRQRLELEVLERVALMEDQLATRAKGADAMADAGVAIPTDLPETREGREEKARLDLADRYAGRFARLNRPDKLSAASDLINAVTSVYDPHTTYLAPADEANFDIEMSGSLEGIGAVLREHDHFVEVVEVVPGGASARQGVLAPGDLILAVAQDGAKAVDVADMPLDEVVGMVRGKKGTVVTLTLRKPTGEVSTLEITRDVVVVEDAYARGAVIDRKGDKRHFGYIHLPSFYGGFGAKRTASADVRVLLDAAADKQLAGVVLDLRSNGGGLLDDAVDLAGLLIDEGPIVQTRRRVGKPAVLRDDTAGTSYDGPVVVLVDRFSASASEIVAGALQDYQRAVIVGTAHTHGKGSVQVLADLDRPGAEPLGDIKLTIQQYFRVSGSSVQWKGVVPDVLLPDPAGHIESGERHLDHSIPWSEIAAAPHTDWVPTWKLDALVAASATRVAADALLSKVAAATELLRKRGDDTRLPLGRDAWTKLRDSRRAELEAAMPDLDKAPQRLTVTDLLPVAQEKTDVAAAEKAKRWRTDRARDPWLEEAAAVLADMAGPAKTPPPPKGKTR